MWLNISVPRLWRHTEDNLWPFGEGYLHSGEVIWKRYEFWSWDQKLGRKSGRAGNSDCDLWPPAIQSNQVSILFKKCVYVADIGKTAQKQWCHQLEYLYKAVNNQRISNPSSLEPSDEFTEHRKPFSEGKWLKDCVVKAARLLIFVRKALKRDSFYSWNLRQYSSLMK